MTVCNGTHCNIILGGGETTPVSVVRSRFDPANTSREEQGTGETLCKIHLEILTLKFALKSLPAISSFGDSGGRILRTMKIYPHDPHRSGSEMVGTSGSFSTDHYIPLAFKHRPVTGASQSRLCEQARTVAGRERGSVAQA
ncbi:hypothetical protein P4O66_016179 [Electrophorus voltai]|uniref:Uncharacterized protein n=1 Tax=Electrophorus voltai TaxID=2609070 RepID=A0AAD8YVU9_9TELE|nr:hypothetical protein P4O66_016179 [Electrophorus voltai]